MAYYAALVSTVQFLEEMSHSEHQDPNSLFEKQQITSLYQTLSDLQKSLEDFSPNDQEASGLLDRIRDAACLAQDLIEYQIPEAASQARDIFESHVPAQAECTYIFDIPDAVYQAESIIESAISDQIREPNCVEEIIHVAFSLFVSACQNSEPVKVTLRKGYEDFLKLTKQIRSIVRKGYIELEKLINEVGSVNVGRIHVDLVKLKKKLDSHKVKGYLDLVKLKEEIDPIDVKQGYPYLVKLKEELDAIDIKGYLDLVKLKKELEPIVVNGYQDLLKLKEELDSFEEKGFQDWAKEEVDSIVGRGYQVLERVKEEVDSIVGMGCKYLLENVNEVVDYIGRRGYQTLEKLSIDSINMGKGCLNSDLEKLNEELEPIVVKGYQDLVILKKILGAIARRGNQNVKNVKEVDFVAGRGYRDLERVKEEVDSIVGRAYRDLERLKEEIDSIVGKRYKDLLAMVKEEVDSISGDLNRIKERNTTHQYNDLQDRAGVSTQGPSDGTTTVGFEQHRARLKAQIFGNSSKFEVISIVGMGGIGKTTLARHIFDDKSIQNHFDFCVWVTISQAYHLQNILLAIADSLNMKKEDLHGVAEKELKDRIRKHLFGKRYLIIMDDVWDTKILDDRKLIFPDDETSTGRIMITTRQSDVASLATESEFTNQIPFLGYNQSWDLFCKKVFCPPELEYIGRSIVKSCQGLPLAVVVVAGLLSKTSKTRDRWGDIARQLSSIAAENDARFSKILSLSYDHLPHHLKPCFLYLGGFPEDYEISVSKLGKLWVAEGFLKPIASKRLEEAAEEYLEELVKRNLVLITKRRSNGKFRCCSIHDLLRDLCAERARREHFLIFLHKYSATTTRHNRFIIYPDSPSNISMPEKDFLQVRSFLSFGNKPVYVSSHPSNFKPLRVLDAPYTNFTFSPFELLHLRYLVLLSSEFQIPSSIFKLQHLQTFIVVSSRSQMISLPSEIWKMPRLEHVMGDRLKLTPFVDVGGNIHDRVPSRGVLQTLSTLVDSKFNRDTVQMMPSLKKLKLQFSRFKPVENVWEKFGIKYLFHLSQLETLDIKIVKEQLNLTPFPESFSFPLTLKKLNLRGCRLPWEDMTLVGSLPNLEVLNLRRDSFVGEEWETKEGEFSKLKFLLMGSLTDLKCWQTERTHFPCLEHLVIHGCHDLEGIPSEIGEFPNLRLIEVSSCNSGVKSSAEAIEEELSAVGNPVLQVRAT